MKKILFVNACVNRDISRTDRLARAVLDHISADDDLVQELVLEELDLQPLDSERLNRRSAAIERGDFSDALFDQAKQLKEADVVLIAAPYWDFSFPANLKIYFELLCAQGVTFTYGEDGTPTALCRGTNLYYVTTAGGYLGEYNYGFDQAKALFDLYFCFEESVCVAAEGLDIVTNDAAAIMDEALEAVRLL